MVKMINFPIGMNPKRPGFMEDECPNDQIVEFIGCSAKLYYYRTQSGVETMKAKGVKTKKKIGYLSVMITTMQYLKNNPRLLNKDK